MYVCESLYVWPAPSRCLSSVGSGAWHVVRLGVLTSVVSWLCTPIECSCRAVPATVVVLLGFRLRTVSSLISQLYILYRTVPSSQGTTRYWNCGGCCSVASVCSTSRWVFPSSTWISIGSEISRNNKEAVACWALLTADSSDAICIWREYFRSYSSRAWRQRLIIIMKRTYMLSRQQVLKLVAGHQPDSAAHKWK